VTINRVASLIISSSRYGASSPSFTIADREHHRRCDILLHGGMAIRRHWKSNPIFRTPQVCIYDSVWTPKASNAFGLKDVNPFSIADEESDYCRPSKLGHVARGLGKPQRRCECLIFAVCYQPLF
jgi:hypothetical protein